MNSRTGSLIYRRGKRIITLQPGQYIISRNTPVGESAEIYRIYPGNGRVLIPSHLIIKSTNRTPNATNPKTGNASSDDHRDRAGTVG